MKRQPLLTLILCLLASAQSFAEKHRLIILADMGNEPDEVQQMIHMITCANEFDIEGLIAVTGKYLRPESKREYRRHLHPELFLEIIDAYEKVLPNLRLHANGWPSAEFLRTKVVSGQRGYGLGDIGEGKSSEGSKLIESVAGNDDPRPLWIVVNAGSNTLAQALADYERNHTPKQLEQFVNKLRVFENGAQDNAGAWICSRYPQIHWIRSNYQTYAYGGPGGKDGNVAVNLGPRFWGDHEYSVDGQLAWQKEHIMNNHGPLGDLYPERRFHNGKLGFIEGGGTIPWLGLVNKGLFDINQPSWGGWSGRFSKKKVPDFWSRHRDIQVDEKENTPFHVYREVSDHWIDARDGKVYANDYTPVWRWREATYNNQICRMDWCVQPFGKANHHPVAAIDGDLSNAIIHVNASAGETLSFDASASKDPDGDALVCRWWIYPEAGTYPGIVHLGSSDQSKIALNVPTGACETQIHLILEVRDTSEIASLFDYRRIVIDVDDRIVGHKAVQK
ncbi:MAG: nucleoside hydrolase-like domain-containing protein [Verrucomicrobiota bacterium]